jgi:predicted Zn-dependent protease
MAFINFLQKLQSASGQPEFLRTHPTSANRIEELRSQIADSEYSSQQGLGTTTYESNIYPLN